MKYSQATFLLLCLGFTLLLGLFSQIAAANCVQDSTICAEGPEERLISGYPVYHDCWRFASQYTCDGTTAVPDSHCQDLIDEGCSPVGQTCDADSCVQTYECVTGTTTTQTGVDCESQSVAVGSVSFDTGYAPSSDFGKAASNMAAMESAVTGMIKDDESCAESPAGSGNFVCGQPILIFNGAGKKCRKDSFGFNVCCNLNGWGVDSGLNVCNQEEEELGYARQDGRTHYVGSYCTHSNVFGCYAHAYMYCVFTSKIGRIVQEQGRTQLGIGWGSPTTPNCAGFTDAELATIDFALIDFSEYFADAFAAMTNPPTGAAMEGIVNTYINTLQNAGCSQFDQGCLP
jgi:conjugal transfer mating pair stabilization protein TraN